MPIKPENKKLYPKDWQRIRARILAREGHCCRLCFAQNHTEGYRTSGGKFYPCPRWNAGPGTKIIKIVLTVAHLDHDPTNNEDWNLAALCQRCHNIIDGPHRRKNAAETRARKAKK